MGLSAPQFPESFQWINTKQPLRIEEFKGHPILLDFWTFCCINCIHILPDLKKLEQEFSTQGLVVIGVHSAKFSHEQDYQNILQACHRNHVNHPVVVDENMQIWKSYAIRSWPSFVLIDSNGDIFFTASGEGKYELLREQVLKLLENTSLPEIKLSQWETIEDKINLRYPIKTVATEIEEGRNYFISDSYNNRIVQLNDKAQFVTSFGEGILKSPQGLCVWKNELLVCDTENHRIVAFDLMGTPQRKYRILAGKGNPGFFDAKSEYDAKLAPLNSPADICIWGNNLAIACSGSHQIVIYSPRSDSIVHIAGSGREDILDGAAPLAALAQPTGVCAISDDKLAFTDSETSSLRSLEKNWNDTGKTVITTLVGEGLFEFGFKNGQSSEARLQHPLSCAWSPETRNLYIADTYNNAVRIYSLELDFLGTLELSEILNEPSGISWYQGDLIITNCNANNFFIVKEKDILESSGSDSNYYSKVTSVFSGPFGNIADYSTLDSKKNVC
jgi:thiol-disulfide isomerase/thioredoxin